MKCMYDKSNGLSFQDPTQQYTTQHIRTGFVDDTTHWTNNFHRTLHGTYSTTEMLRDNQTTAQWWEQLLHTMGGKLELSKCFYYKIKGQFNTEGEPALSQTQDTQHAVQITSSETGSMVNISEKPPTESHKTLGVLENPAG